MSHETITEAGHYRRSVVELSEQALQASPAVSLCSVHCSWLTCFPVAGNCVLSEYVPGTHAVSLAVFPGTESAKVG